MASEQPRIIAVPRIYDPRGSLSFVQDDEAVIPFEVKRVFWVYDVPGGESRGEHAHRSLRQFIVATSGSFSMSLDDGLGHKYDFRLYRPFEGLYLPPGYWGHMYDFSSGAVGMVLASDFYREEEYFREYENFLSYVRSLS